MEMDRSRAVEGSLLQLQNCLSISYTPFGRRQAIDYTIQPPAPALISVTTDYCVYIYKHE